MHRLALVLAAVALVLPAGAAAGDNGLVYRYYAGYGYRLNPLLSFAQLENRVSAHDARGARALAARLVARGTHRGDALYWTYDFPFGGCRAGWTSGFAQAIAAESLAQTARLSGDRTALAAARAAFRGLRRTLLIRIGGGEWVQEYSCTGEVILNAQLESLLALELYERIVGTPDSRATIAALERATIRLLPRFDLGTWGRYELGGPAADTHYEAYHVDLLRRLAAHHREPIWRQTYLRWRAGLG
ncbi:MAG TPA: D-glucuronyl C5-epimerase family protein [Gaiellaceae bacterium]